MVAMQGSAQLDRPSEVDEAMVEMLQMAMEKSFLFKHQRDECWWTGSSPHPLWAEMQELSSLRDKSIRMASGLEDVSQVPLETFGSKSISAQQRLGLSSLQLPAMPPDVGTSSPPPKALPSASVGVPQLPPRNVKFMTDEAAAGGEAQADKQHRGSHEAETGVGPIGYQLPPMSHEGSAAGLWAPRLASTAADHSAAALTDGPTQSSLPTDPLKISPFNNSEAAALAYGLLLPPLGPSGPSRLAFHAPNQSQPSSIHTTPLKDSPHTRAHPSVLLLNRASLDVAGRVNSQSVHRPSFLNNAQVVASRLAGSSLGIAPPHTEEQADGGKGSPSLFGGGAQKLGGGLQLRVDSYMSQGEWGSHGWRQVMQGSWLSNVPQDLQRIPADDLVKVGDNCLVFVCLKQLLIELSYPTALGV